LLAVFSLVPSSRLDLLAAALQDGCCCHESERPHAENCPCKVCTHKHHAASRSRAITTCRGILESGVIASSPDPVSPPVSAIIAGVIARVPPAPSLDVPAPEPAREVPTPTPLRAS